MSTPISATATVVTVNTASAKSITLPSAASRLGRIITVKDLTGNAGTNNISVFPYDNGGTPGDGGNQAQDLIEGVSRVRSSVTPLPINVAFGAVTLISVFLGSAVTADSGTNTTGFGWRIISSTFLNSVVTATITNLTVTGSEVIQNGANLTLQSGTYLNLQGNSIISTSGDIYVGTGIRISAARNLATFPNLSANLVSIGQLYVGSLTGLNQTTTAGISTNFLSVGQAFIANLITANEFITNSFSTVVMSVGQAYLGSTTTSFLSVVGQMSTLNNVGIGGQLSVTAATTLNSTLTVVGQMSTLSNVGVGGVLSVTGATFFNSNVTLANTSLTVNGLGSLIAPGLSTTSISSGISYAGLFTGPSHSTIFLSAGQAYIDNLRISTLNAVNISTTSNVGIGGQLSVTAATTLNSTLIVVGRMSTLSTLAVGESLSVRGLTTLNSNLIVQAVGGAASIIVNTTAGAISIGNSTGDITTAGGSFSATTGINQFGTNLILTGYNGADYARLANVSTNMISSGNITVGNTLNAFIASTQQNIASSFFGNLADAQTVVVQTV
jgi:hypothetical protein